MSAPRDPFAADPSAPDPELDALALGELDDRDAAILGALAAGWADADPVPPRLVDRVAFAVTLDALEAELADLQRTADEQALAGVRSDGSGDTYTVTFTTPSTTIMVTISGLGPDLARIDGWVTPGAHVTVDLRGSDTLLTTVADEDGRFVFDGVGRGFAQFVVRPVEGDARPVITPAVEL